MPNTRRMALSLEIPHSDILRTLADVLHTEALDTFLTPIGVTNDGESVYFIPETVAQKVYEAFTTTVDTPEKEATNGSD